MLWPETLAGKLPLFSRSLDSGHRGFASPLSDAGPASRFQRAVFTRLVCAAVKSQKSGGVCRNLNRLPVHHAHTFIEIGFACAFSLISPVPFVSSPRCSKVPEWAFVILEGEAGETKVGIDPVWGSFRICFASGACHQNPERLDGGTQEGRRIRFPTLPGFDWLTAQEANGKVVEFYRQVVARPRRPSYRLRPPGI